jgi:hypothetical protein
VTAISLTAKTALLRNAKLAKEIELYIGLEMTNSLVKISARKPPAAGLGLGEIL